MALKIPFKSIFSAQSGAIRKIVPGFPLGVG
jgi:hypothetical protein